MDPIKEDKIDESQKSINKRINSIIMELDILKTSVNNLINELKDLQKK